MRDLRLGALGLVDEDEPAAYLAARRLGGLIVRRAARRGAPATRRRAERRWLVLGDRAGEADDDVAAHEVLLGRPRGRRHA